MDLFIGDIQSLNYTFYKIKKIVFTLLLTYKENKNKENILIIMKILINIIMIRSLSIVFNNA